MGWVKGLDFTQNMFGNYWTVLKDTLRLAVSKKMIQAALCRVDFRGGTSGIRESR